MGEMVFQSKSTSREKEEIVRIDERNISKKSHFEGAVSKSGPYCNQT